MQFKTGIEQATTVIKQTPKTSQIPESKETQKMSTTELQRLVLMEQLKTTRVQYEYYKLKVQKLREESNNNTDVHSGENDMSD